MAAVRLLEFCYWARVCVHYLSQLSPIQVMPSVELEDKDVIDLVQIPKFAINTKQEH
jgi:hypothetical protein